MEQNNLQAPSKPGHLWNQIIYKPPGKPPMEQNNLQAMEPRANQVTYGTK